MPTADRSRILLGLLLVVVFGGFIGISLLGHRAERFPLLGAVGEFSLTDSRGLPFSSNDLVGKVWVAHFFFTSCPDVCPPILGRLSTAVHEYVEAQDVRFVSITSDPRTDTPEVLSKFAQRFDADPKLWNFLTGSPEQIAAVSEGTFKFASPLENPMLHATRLILVDRTMQIRGHYDGGSSSAVAQLREDIGKLLVQ